MLQLNSALGSEKQPVIHYQLQYYFVTVSE